LVNDVLLRRCSITAVDVHPISRIIKKDFIISSSVIHLLSIYKIQTKLIRHNWIVDIILFQMAFSILNSFFFQL